MYNILKKHRRRILAIAVAFLMIAFLIPSLRGTGNSDFAIGKVYGKKIYISELKQAQFRWNLLRTKILVQSQAGLMPVTAELGQYANEQIEEHPELFMLLAAEARRQGVFISDETLKDKHQSLIILPDPNLDMTRADVANTVNGALRDLLMIKETFDRALSAIHVSQPMRDYEIARLQQVKMAAVDFRSSEHIEQLPPPTEEQLQQQFAKYKDVLPASSRGLDKSNPFGFGYRLPDRVQIQFVMVPTEQVRSVVEAGKDAKRWRVDARRFYNKYPEMFSATTQPAGATQPTSTTRPFEQVSKEALEAVIKPEVDKQQQAIVSRINQILATDWNAFRIAKDAQANSSLGVPFNSYQYMQRLAEEIEKQFRVQISIGASGSLLGAGELAQLGPIAQSATLANVGFPIYATITEQQRKNLVSRMPGLPQALELWQPSQMLRDADSNNYIFRRTAYEAEHSPKDIEEVRARVERDVKSLRAFEKAREAAEQFVAAAKQDGLAKAAEAAKRPVADTGMISRDSGVAMGLHLSDSGTRQFVAKAMDELLARRAAGEEQPIAAVAVEQEGRVIVARLDEVKAEWKAEQIPMLTSYVQTMTAQRLSQPMQAQWYDYNNVRDRVEYQPDQATYSNEQPSAPQQAPRNPLGI